jgi:hypothetical protein
MFEIRAEILSLINMIGTVIGAFAVDYLGPKWCQITGLLAQAVIGFIMSGAYVPFVSRPSHPTLS